MWTTVGINRLTPPFPTVEHHCKGKHGHLCWSCCFFLRHWIRVLLSALPSCLYFTCCSSCQISALLIQIVILPTSRHFVACMQAIVWDTGRRLQSSSRRLTAFVSRILSMASQRDHLLFWCVCFRIQDHCLGFAVGFQDSGFMVRSGF